MTAYRGRFAPSPTGPLHFGSLVAAVASHLDARAAGGEWRVRIEDVDEARTVPGASGAILRQLESFGLEWDGEVVVQSRRKPLYEAALARLRAQGLVYRCRCSRREIADSALRGIEGAIYPGTCRMLHVDAGTPGAERLLVEGASLAFDDRVQGTITQDVTREIGDFVLKRRDGLHAYQLAVVVDDADQGITDVVRGADLLHSTPRQILLQRLLGYPTPRYLHFPVATHENGEKLSKQTLAVAADDREAAALLGAALRFLGQADASPGAAPREILALAARRWSPAAIPRRTAAVAPAGARPGV
ncbi:MAG: tRNA glutamyl-Q(34) synthetase GluQRS [Usitatibacter sp.]